MMLGVRLFLLVCMDCTPQDVSEQNQIKTVKKLQVLSMVLIRKKSDSILLIMMITIVDKTMQNTNGKRL